MNDYFNDQNVLTLEGTCERDVDPQETPRTTFRWEWCLVMHRCRIIIAVVSIILMIGLVISLAVIATSKNTIITKKEEALCLTPECIHTASAILKSLNQKIMPCDDFYNFTCGGYLESASIPDGEMSISHFSELERDVEIQIKSIVEEPGNPDEPKHVQLVKTLYKTCMNTTALENTGLKPLHGILEKLGKWPVLEGDNWKEENFDWLQTTYKANNLGYLLGSQFVTVTIIPHPLIGNKYIIQLRQSSLSLSRDILAKGLRDNEHLTAYASYMRDIAKLLGAEGDRVSHELDEVLAFEMELANITVSDTQKPTPENPASVRMTLAEMTKRYPSVNWVEYVNGMLPSTVQFNAEEVVMVEDRDYFGKLANLLNKTEKRVQANYMLWRIVKASIKYLNKNIRDRQIEYTSSAIDNAINISPRWKQCVKILSHTILAHSVNALYIKRYYNEAERRNVVEMVDGIKKELIKILKKADWMDEITRDKAIEKATFMYSSVAYPVELLDEKVLEKLYNQTEISSDTFLGNILELNRMLIDLEIKLLRNPANKTTAHDISTTVNAYYFIHENNISFPASLLRGAFFGMERPRYVNYGAIGSVIGHEFTHGFDTIGVLFDKDGNRVNWWDPETKREYLKRAVCISRQYSNYTVDSSGKKIDGLKTLNENIADIGGFRKAYLAYKEWVKKNGPEPKLPGLNYTQEQMFWISAGSMWCKKFTNFTIDDLDALKTHSPQRFRVIGSFSNLPEFAADFNCPRDSFMNPVHKCSLL